jgi:hypothetical protein
MQIKRRDIVLGIAFRALAQEPRFSTEVKVVTLFATVHDRDGAMGRSSTAARLNSWARVC